MRAGKIFINDLVELGLLDKVRTGRTLVFALLTKPNDLIGKDGEDYSVSATSQLWSADRLFDHAVSYGSLAATGRPVHSKSRSGLTHARSYRKRVCRPSCLQSSHVLRSALLSHHTPQAILLGLEGSDPETIDTGTIPPRYANIIANKTLMLGGAHRIAYEPERDMVWRWDEVLKTHPNGMRFSVFGQEGELLATNEYFRCAPRALTRTGRGKH